MSFLESPIPTPDQDWNKIVDLEYQQVSLPYLDEYNLAKVGSTLVQIFLNTPPSRCSSVSLQCK